MEVLLGKTGELHGVRTWEIECDEPFIDLAERFVDDPHTICLMSGGDLDCSRYHILAVKPWLVCKGCSTSVELTSGDVTVVTESDPLDIVKYLLGLFRLEKETLPFPVSSGLFGYFSYDLKDTIEILPRTSVNDLELPDLYLIAPSVIIVEDKLEHKRFVHVAERTVGNTETCDADVEWLNSRLCKQQKTGGLNAFSGGGKGFRSNFDKATYMEAIRRIREYIRAGDIYQVNMSQRFQAGFSGSTYSLFKTLYDMNPAPFFAYVNAGDHQIVSTSPERFILRNKTRVESRPIKGTRPRGVDEQDDHRLKEELRKSTKDDAELSMIVDLIRNDIGKVCKGGSVSVAEHKRVEAYKNVFHLITVVEGELDDDVDSVDLIRATFPGGSITGCPKIRSMEIIDEMESNRRHIYTGSIGYISFHDTMDLSIAIRTATVYNGRIIFSVGGGVVFDSDPEDEYNETLHKGQTLLNVFTGNSEGAEPGDYIWINGAIKNLADAGVPVSDSGFQYGYGFFETLRIVDGDIRFLKEHLGRLKQSWRIHFNREFPDVTWETVIRQVLAANGLETGVAAVKIITTKGSRDKAPLDNTLIVMARPYVHRLDVIRKKGIDLITCSEIRHTPLAAHKSLNYLYYYLEGQKSANNGGDEALILNRDGSVSETNTANIFFIKEKRLTVPVSEFVLPGIMSEKVIPLLESWDYTVDTRRVYPDELALFDQVFITNSLMGAVPVQSLDGHQLIDSSWICREINDVLL